MKMLIFILFSLSISWYFTDLKSSEILYNKVAPFGVYYFLFSLVIWLAIKLKTGNKKTKTNSKVFSWRADTSEYFNLGFSSGDSGESGGDGGGS